MTEAEIRAAVNAWSASGFLRKSRLGDEISIAQTIPGAAHVVHVVTQCERRLVVRTPHDGTPNASAGHRILDPASASVPGPDDFQDATTDLPIAGTEQITSCRTCDRAGRVKCATCSGSGWTKCRWCNGMGTRSVSQTRPVFRGGKTTYETRMVSASCTCRMGRVKCQTCSGDKTVECAACRGSGELRTIDVLHVEFRTKSLRRVINSTPLPAELLREAQAERILEKESSAPSVPQGTPSDVRPALKEMLEEARCDAGKIVRTLVVVERLPIECVQFTSAKHGSGKLWIYGTDAKVHAPDVRSGWLGWLRR
jgi:hypothetical protein